MSDPDTATATRTDPAPDSRHGVDPAVLDESALVRELAHLHATRHETFLHGSVDALREHTTRMGDLEREWVRRHPERDVDAGRTRAGARSRG